MIDIEADEAAWSDPDRAVQIEDDTPESLAGEAIEFDPDEDTEPQDFLSDPASSTAGVVNLPEGA